MVTKRMLVTLERAHQSFVQQIAAQRPIINRVTGVWTYLPAAKMLGEVRLLPIGEYLV